MPLRTLLICACLGAAWALDGFAVGAESLIGTGPIATAAPIDSAESPSAPTTKTPPVGMFGHVSARVLNHLVHREFDRKENVVESILSMSTRGTAHADCVVGVELLPNPQAASVRFLMNGRAVMNNTVGTTRSVQLYTSSQTDIAGHKDVIIDIQGLKLLPSRAECRTSLQVNQIDARNRIVERLAWRRVGRVQGQAEQIASERAARRAEGHLEIEFNAPLRQLQDKYVENVLSPLTSNEAIADVRFATTREHLSFGLLMRAGHAARSPAPTPAHDVSVCIRDEFVNRVADSFISGKTFTDRQFAELMQTLTGSVPRALWVHSRAEPWTVTTAAQNPLRVDFDGDEVRVALNIERATHGDRQLHRPLAVSAAYTLEITRDGPRLVRAGDLTLEFSGPDAQRPADAAETQFKPFLYRKFAAVFPPELYFDGLTPPAGGFWARLRQLSLTQLTARDGWLAVGYEWTSHAPVTTALVER